MSSPPSLRLIAHIDMDAFFASVEQRKHPEWGNDPVLVGVFTGRSEDSGVVSSASYSARKMGVRAGMPIFQAKNLCPSAHWVSVNHAEYSTISEQIFTRLFSFADVVELASIDEAYADLSIKAKGDFSAAESLLREFQTLVKKEWGLSCSVGLSVNKLVAKMASDARKPAGFTVVHPDEVSMFLDPLPIKALLGVGPKTRDELKEKGIETILDIRRAGLSDLVKWLGTAKGNYLFAASRGIDAAPLDPNRERKQHSRIVTLLQDAQSWTDVAPRVHDLVELVWSETAEKGQFFTQLGVLAISSSLKQYSKSKSLTVPCATKEQFSGEIESLFLLLLETEPFLIRRIGVRVSGFTAPPKQKRLFDF